MKLKVQFTSGPSHQTYANGKPCDRYVGTVYLTNAAYACGWQRFTKQIIGKTEDAVKKALDKYHWESIVEIPESELDPAPRLKKGVDNANA